MNSLSNLPPLPHPSDNSRSFYSPSEMKDINLSEKMFVYFHINNSIIMKIDKYPETYNQQWFAELESSTKIGYVVEIKFTDLTAMDNFNPISDPVFPSLLQISVNRLFKNTKHNIVYFMFPWSYPKDQIVALEAAHQWKEWANQPTNCIVKLSIYEVQIGALYNNGLAVGCPVMLQSQNRQSYNTPAKQRYNCVVL